ncbi:MAG: cytochrome c, class I [Rhodocyclales bacterium GWA2_65_20]|nr:MAG: cytochrome c, class I [Rhodocyclales bacterium GWA2_65_20]
MKAKHLLAIAAGIAAAAAACAQESRDSKKIMDRVKEIVGERCSLCHGAKGESASDTFPRLAAQHPAYIVKQLRDFRDGRRKGTMMNDMANGLTEEEIAGLAVYFSTKKPVSRKTLDTEFANVGAYIFHKGNPYSGVAACASCHGPEGYGTIQLPRLAGQNSAYLETQLGDFNKRERTNDNAIMHAIASKMTTFEIKAVAAYVGGLE